MERQNLSDDIAALTGAEDFEDLLCLLHAGVVTEAQWREACSYVGLGEMPKPEASEVGRWLLPESRSIRVSRFVAHR